MKIKSIALVVVFIIIFGVILYLEQSNPNIKAVDADIPSISQGQGEELTQADRARISAKEQIFPRAKE